MTNTTSEDSPKPPKAQLNQNLVIAIIGAVATVIAAVIPWALDRNSQATSSPAPTAIQAAITTAAPTEEAAAPAAEIPASATIEPTIAATPTQESGIFNIYTTLDFDGKLLESNFKSGQPIYVFFNINDPSGKNIVRVIVSALEVPGVLPDSQFYNTVNEYKEPDVKLVVSQGGLQPGKYKIDILLNNTLEGTIEFTVTK
jgi:hypothetical protein